ncbi:hypothetical protein [Pararhodospirillum photometricum]|uniref:hypothetical protein n=1 Tax=Pararhodospirillum photometricum TaxID=1084 RepID=UPI0005A100CB|nr:hypothetical protein [Pararhodospirillum photometricum]
MRDLHAFFDKDVFIKLACCNLWDEALGALGVTHPYRLSSATASGAKTALRRMAIDDALRAATGERLTMMARQVPVVPERWVAAAVTTELYNNMISHAGIDAGEAQIALVALYCECNKKLVTGDKRFVGAMARLFPGEFERLRPMILSFERCLLAVCEVKGYEAIKDRLSVAKGCDGALRLAIGEEGQASASSFKNALSSFSPL